MLNQTINHLVNPKKTVLILGAGASAPYGFPAAKAMLEEIKISLEPDHELQKYLKEATFAPSDIANLLSLLNRTKISTIDEFLSMQAGRNRSYVEMIKYAIAYILLRQEANPESLKINDWYTKLYNRLFDRTEDGPSDDIAIITFNYDRSLEESLCHICAARNVIKPEEARRLPPFNNIPIVHVHGELKSSGYGVGHDDFDDVMEASDGIIVATSDQIDQGPSEELRKARRYISGAESIFILGFGYNDENIKKIGLSANIINDMADIRGTAFGVSAPQQGRIREKIDGIELSDIKIDDFLDNVWA